MNKTGLDHISDSQLLENFYNSRDNDWLGILLPRYTLLLFGVCLKYLKNEEEAKDAVQQIFLKTISELQKYRVGYFKSWLYMVARNHCLMHIRYRNGKIPKELNEQMQVPDDGPQLKTLIEKDALLTLIETSIPELNEEQKTCVTLFYMEKKTYNEISEKTGYTTMQVKSHIQNGKRNLKILVENKMKYKK